MHTQKHTKETKDKISKTKLNSSIKLNIGCGIDKKPQEEGWINIDIIRDICPDMCFDISNDKKWNKYFKDNSISEILVSYVLCQIHDNQDFINLMNQFWRILKKNSKLIIKVPNAKYSTAWNDPLDNRRFSEKSWDYLNYKHYRYKAFHYGFKPWKVLKIKNISGGKSEIKDRLYIEMSPYKYDKEKNHQNYKKNYSKYRDKFIERAKKWALNNPEKVRKISRKSHRKNIDKEKEYRRLYYQNNREKINKSIRKYRKKNKDKVNFWSRRRRNNKNNGGGSHTLKQWQKLKGVYNYCCVECGILEVDLRKKYKDKVWHKLTEDHIIPSSKWEDYIQQNQEIGYLFDDIENIQPLCVSCNSRKYNHISYKQEKINENSNF